MICSTCSSACQSSCGAARCAIAPESAAPASMPLMTTSRTEASLDGDTSWARLATRVPGRTHTSPLSGTI